MIGTTYLWRTNMEKTLSNYISEAILKKDGKTIPNYIEVRKTHNASSILLKNLFQQYFQIDWELLCLYRLKHYVYFQHYCSNNSLNQQNLTEIENMVTSIYDQGSEEYSKMLQNCLHDYENVLISGKNFIEKKQKEFDNFIIDGKPILKYKPEELENKIDEKLTKLNVIMTYIFGEEGTNNSLVSANHRDFISESMIFNSLPQDFAQTLKSHLSNPNDTINMADKEKDILNFLENHTPKTTTKPETQIDETPFIEVGVEDALDIIDSDNPLFNKYETIRVSGEFADTIIETFIDKLVEFDSLNFLETLFLADYNNAENFSELMLILQDIFLITYAHYKNNIQIIGSEEHTKSYNNNFNDEEIMAIFNVFKEDLKRYTMPAIQKYIQKHMGLTHSIYINFWNDFGGVIYGALRDTINNAIVKSNKPLIEKCENYTYNIQDFLINIPKRIDDEYYLRDTYDDIIALENFN